MIYASSRKSRAAAAASKWTFGALVSLLWAYYGAEMASRIGVDYKPIVETFEDIRQIENFYERLQYALFGNGILVFIYDQAFPNSSSSDITFLLYLVSSFFRSMILIYLIGFRRALLLLFAYEWALDFNQSRYSLAMSFLFLALFLEKKRLLILSIASHLSAAPFSIYLSLTSRLRLLFIASAALFAVLVLPNFFPRYFIVFEDHTLPLNTVIYTIVIAAVGSAIANAGHKVPEVGYFVLMVAIFLLLMQMGLSPLYIGRISEMVSYYILARTGFLLNSKLVIGANKQRLEILFMASSLLIFAYQTTTIFGNVWRFF